MPSHLGSVVGSGTYKVGTNANLSVVNLEDDSKFLHWEDSDGNLLGTTTNLSHLVDGNTTITAVFADNRDLGVTFLNLETIVVSPNTGTVTGNGTYLANVEVELEATPAEGLDFVGWAGDFAGTSPLATVALTKNMSVKAVFGDHSVDSDKDSLSDTYENIIGSDPNDKDTDNDGLYDGDEVNTHGTSPLLVDSDGDTHDDNIEILHSSDPNDADDYPFLAEKNLALHYMFKGKSYDSSEFKRHGTIKNAVLDKDRFHSGKNAYRFDGNKSSIEATGYKGPAGDSARTVSGWVRGKSGGDGAIVSWGKSGNTFEINVATGVLQVVADAGTLEGSTDVLDDEWHQFVISLPEGVTLGSATLYIDGKEETTSSTGDTSSAVSTVNGGSLTIGDGPSGNYTGWIDDVRVWERALDPTEAQKLFALEESSQTGNEEAIKPSISQHPSHATIAVGDDATFTVTAEGKPAPTYQWEKKNGKKWIPVQDATSPTLTIEAATATDMTSYRVIVSNSEGSRKSKNAKLLILEKPSFTEQPGNQQFIVGKTGNVYVQVSGSKKLLYEWFKDGESIGTTNSNKISLRKMKPSDHDGTYSVKVSNAVGEITSEDFQISVIEPVQIDTNPEDAGIVIGNDGTLTVAASGGGTLSYQWFKYDSKKHQWNEVEGATSA
ncbi:MAG: immunoglobulin domain-containing protein, partial [Opitutae bacterium]